MEINKGEIVKKVFCQPLGEFTDQILGLDVHIVDHCNLNCARCFKFSPVAKPKFISRESIRKDLERMHYISFAKLPLGISIIGGEPLIHPDLVGILSDAREVFTETPITIITNGISLPSMSKDFYECIRETNIHVVVSKYFDNEYYNKIRNTFETYGLGYLLHFHEVESFGCAMFLNVKMTHNNNMPIENIWEQCPIKNGYVFLREGKISSCPMHQMKFILNERFNETFKEFDDDSISIHDASYQEIIEYLKKPKKSCQYCWEDSLKHISFPEISNGEKSEWINE